MDKLTSRVELHHEHMIGSRALLKAVLVLVPVATAFLVVLLNWALRP